MFVALGDALEEAIEAHRQGNRVPHQEMHKRVKSMYTWHNVAKRTEKVPEILDTPPKTLIPSLVPYRFMTLLLQLPGEAILRESTGSKANIVSCIPPSHLLPPLQVPLS